MDDEFPSLPVDAREILLASGYLPTEARERLIRANGYDEICRAVIDVFSNTSLDHLGKFNEAELGSISEGAAAALRHLDGRA